MTSHSSFHRFLMVFPTLFFGVLVLIGIGIATYTAWQEQTNDFLTKAATTQQPLYIAPSGNDASGNGTSSNPYKTLKRAMQHVGTSTNFVIYFKEGTYVVGYSSSHDGRTDYAVSNFHPTTACDAKTRTGMLTITVDPEAVGNVILKASGDFSSAGKGFFRISSSECIHVDGANKLIIDGSGGKFAQTHESLVDITSWRNPSSTSATEGILRNIIFEKTTVMNAGTASTSDLTTRGIHFIQYYKYDQPSNIIIQDNTIHDVKDAGISGFGNDVLLANNRIYNVVLRNKDNAMCTSSNCGGWPGAVILARHYDTGAKSTNIKVIGNTISNSWGEGIVSAAVDVKLVGNTVHDVYSVGIYLDNTKNVLVDRNHIYRSTSAYDRSADRVNYRRMHGISMANENVEPTPTILDGITISNNIIVGVKNGINYAYDSSYCLAGSTYTNLQIVHNTITDVGDYALFMAKTSGIPYGAVVANNIFSRPGVGSYNIGNESAWTFTNNLWTTSFPASTTITHVQSFSCVGASVPCPGFAGTNATVPESYKLVAQALPVGKGVQTTTDTDYWGTARSVPATLGAYEPSRLSSTPTSIPTSAPTPLATPTPSPVATLPTIQFATSSQMGLEEKATILVKITLSSVAKQPVTVRYRLRGGTATQGSDYTFTAGKATIPVGSLSTTFSFSTLDDLLQEPNETIIFALRDPVGAVMGKRNVYTYTITQSD